MKAYILTHADPKNLVVWHRSVSLFPFVSKVDAKALLQRTCLWCCGPSRPFVQVDNFITFFFFTQQTVNKLIFSPF